MYAAIVQATIYTRNMRNENRGWREVFFCLGAGAPAADEVDDLDPVAFIEHRRVPFPTTDHLAVDFDGDPFGSERELLDECRDGRAFMREVLFTVDDNLQRTLPPYA